MGAYIVLGIAAIGREIENPFGNDVNDLALENFCDQLTSEINQIAARPPPRPEQFFSVKGNRVLGTWGDYEALGARSEEDIRGALRKRGAKKVESRNQNGSLVEKAAQGMDAV